MRIAKNTVATIDYKLTDENNAVIDSSEGGEPLSYLHGANNIIPGLEQALAGKQAGDAIKVSIPPAQGYGERDPELMTVVPKTQFESPDSIEVGMQFQTHSDDGAQVVTVVEVDAEKVTVDGNHPLAGMTLNFDVKVVEVRAATAEEISHGHVHGPHDHHHH